MAETLTAEQAGEPRALAGARRPLDHLATFRVTYVSIFAFMVLYVASVQAGGALLQEHFEARVRSAVSVSPVDGPVEAQINNRVSELLETSPWIQLLGVKVNVTVLSANGDRPLYLGARVVRAPPPAPNLEQAMREALEVLPAISDVSVSVPPASLLSTGIFVIYAAVLLQGLFLYNRAQGRREAERLAAAVNARDTAAERAGSIEQELTSVPAGETDRQLGLLLRLGELRRDKLSKPGDSALAFERKLDHGELAQGEGRQDRVSPVFLCLGTVSHRRCVEGEQTFAASELVHSHALAVPR